LQYKGGDFPWFDKEKMGILSVFTKRFTRVPGWSPTFAGSAAEHADTEENRYSATEAKVSNHIVNIVGETLPTRE
jgi:hypothetical protein